MTMIRPETEMKESGVQWIGDIPSDWNTKPLYACLDEINQKNNPVVTTNILSLTNTDGVIPYSERGNQGNKSKENFEEYKVVYPNTIVANSMNILIGSVGLSKYEGCVSPVYYVYMAKPQVDIRYMNYLFQMEPFQKRLRQFANGILEIRLRVSSHDILHQKVAVPAYDEQQVIADYLDETCSKIDEIIAEAKESIDEYKELRQGIIFEAVTKGLDKNVEMKSTSVGWIGTVPSHWRVAKIRQVAEFYNGDRSSKYPSGDDIVSEGIIFITSNNLGYIVLNTNVSTNKFITKQKYDDLGGAKLRINDIVFCLRGSVGKCAINKTFDEGTIASSLVVIRAKKVDADYLNYVLQNHRITDEAIVNAIGIGSLNLAAHDISEFYMPIPPEREMQDIVRYLDDKVGNVDDLISEKESLIADLEAYKKSLIYEVVTGKRRVV